MSKFYDLFPRIKYDITGDTSSSLDTIVDISLRLNILEDVKNNTLSYYEYLIKEDDTPEILADKIYGDAEYHWIILLMNNIINPQFDWPLKTDAFNSYIISKYGSISNAKTQIHHYEKIIRRTDKNTTIFNEIQIEIDETAYNALPEYSLEPEILISGRTIDVEISTRIIYCYDWEFDRNEEKRNIKLLKKQYLGQILSEFGDILRKSGVKPSVSRKIVR